jgi:hypothetical protein
VPQNPLKISLSGPQPDLNYGPARSAMARSDPMRSRADQSVANYPVDRSEDNYVETAARDPNMIRIQRIMRGIARVDSLSALDRVAVGFNMPGRAALSWACPRPGTRSVLSPPRPAGLNALARGSHRVDVLGLPTRPKPRRSRAPTTRCLLTGWLERSPRRWLCPKLRLPLVLPAACCMPLA